MNSSPLLNDPVLDAAPTCEGYKVLGGVALYHKLGQGGMGAVYLGRHLRLNVDVAVKVMIPPSATSGIDAGEYVQRFVREARTAAQISHQHLVRVLDVNVEGGCHFITMEYVDGVSAGRLRKHKGMLTEPLAVAICLGAAGGLAAAHRKSIIHRDIKPDNILISRSGEIKLADLGLAKALTVGEDDGEDVLTQTQQVMGTPSFMAPEQFESAHRAGPGSDVWSLGVTLFELLTGTLPWTDASIFVLANKISQEPPPELQDLCGDLSAGLMAILDKALAKDPADRYGDGATLAAALREHSQTLPRVVLTRADIDAADQPGNTTDLCPDVNTITSIASQLDGSNAPTIAGGGQIHASAPTVLTPRTGSSADGEIGSITAAQGTPPKDSPVLRSQTKPSASPPMILWIAVAALVAILAGIFFGLREGDDLPAGAERAAKRPGLAPAKTDRTTGTQPIKPRSQKGTTVTLSFHNGDVRKVVAQIAAQSKLTIGAPPAMRGAVDIQATDRPWRDALIDVVSQVGYRVAAAKENSGAAAHIEQDPTRASLRRTIRMKHALERMGALPASSAGVVVLSELATLLPEARRTIEAFTRPNPKAAESWRLGLGVIRGQLGFDPFVAEDYVKAGIDIHEPVTVAALPLVLGGGPSGVVVSVGLTDAGTAEEYVKELAAKLGVRLLTSGADAYRLGGQTAVRFTDDRADVMIGVRGASGEHLRAWSRGLAKPVSERAGFLAATTALPSAQIRFYVDPAKLAPGAVALPDSVRQVVAVAGAADLLSANPRTEIHAILRPGAASLDHFKPGPDIRPLLKRLPRPAAAVSVSLSDPLSLLRWITKTADPKSKADAAIDQFLALFQLSAEQLQTIFSGVSIAVAAYPSDGALPTFVLVAMTGDPQYVRETLTALATSQKLMRSDFGGHTFWKRAASTPSLYMGMVDDLLVVANAKPQLKAFAEGTVRGDWMPRVGGTALLSAEADAEQVFAAVNVPAFRALEAYHPQLRKLFGNPFLRIERKDNRIVLRETQDGGKVSVLISVLTAAFLAAVQSSPIDPAPKLPLPAAPRKQ